MLRPTRHRLFVQPKLFPPGWLKLREICLSFRRLCVVVWGCFEAPQNLREDVYLDFGRFHF